jgi:hypothetical protein
MSLHWGLRLLSGLGMLALLASLTPRIAGADTLITYDLKPLNPSQQYFIYSARPGQTIQDVALVRNGGQHNVTLNLRAADALTPDGGGVVFSRAGQRLTRDGAWLAVTQARLAVGPRRSMVVLFTVHVPRTAAPGQHLAALVLETVTAQRAGAHAAYIGSVAVAVVVNVQGKAHAGLRVCALTFSQTATQSVFALAVQNTGQRFLYPQARITVTGAVHHHSASTPVFPLRLLIGGQSTVYQLTMPWHLTSGPYDISATVFDAGTGVTAIWSRHRIIVRDTARQ